ncbi:hypothetical protein EJ08DRAFT_653181 [Tothia fuscella]|uniref:N-acetyltransferase domain-containing protein n=1 Tax=Tothia fuscella TaxID=1048955 RepID=A0A9P4NI26_9PEZI|nr:hypothetical protein EJ08DRAFT_653181 [Tothia fuscella]
MDIKYTPAATGTSSALIRNIVNCGLLAFDNDALDYALFPRNLRTPENESTIYNYRIERMRKRLENPRWRYILAMTDSDDGDGHAKVVGYAGWLAPLQEKKHQHEEGSSPAGDEEGLSKVAENLPQGMEIEVYKHVMDIIENTKKEVLGKGESKVWYLASLAVDPAFKGRSIASNLVKWGLDQADKDQVPAYLESTPAAVGVYERLGFESVKKVRVLKGNEDHILAVMIRKPKVTTET